MTLRPQESNICITKKTFETKYSRGIFETYVSRLESITYRLHSHWRHKTKSFALKVYFLMLRLILF
jgi:hypothetical protein